MSEAMQVRDLRFGYGTSPVLAGVSFSVRRGELLAIVGPNGCGKSTLLRMMAGLLKAQGGEVRIDDRPLAAFSRRRLARQLALLSQSGLAPPGMRVADLVAMGRFAHGGWLRRDTPDDRAHVAAAMERMAVADLAQRRLAELSGGQLQRVRMAMTLAQNAGLLLLDEPTNHLDLKHQYALLDCARAEAHAGRAVVAVLHDLIHASLYADRLILLHQGRILAQGAPEQVLTPQALWHAYGVRTVAIPCGARTIPLPENALL